MKKIFLSTSNVLPIPAVRGGATETLIDILIKENEIKKQCFFYILCKYDQLAELRSASLKFTRIIYFKSIRESSIFELLGDKEIYIYLAARLANLFRLVKSDMPPRYYYFSYRMCKKIRPDYFVAEGGVYEFYEKLKGIISSDRRFAHFHRVVHGNDRLWEIFPNAIGCSEYVKNAYLGQGSANILSANVVRNCCNESFFKKMPKKSLVEKRKIEFEFNDDDFIVIFSGRVVQEKGVLELITAIENISLTNIKLLIVGSTFYASSQDTEYWQAVKDKALSLGNRVVMTGYIPNNELNIYLSMSSLCVVPSVWEEPVALVPLEAMTFGVPVLVTDSGGMIEYQKDDCISIVKRETNLASNLSGAILALYKDDSRREKMILAGKRRAAEFCPKDYYAEFLKVFK